MKKYDERIKNIIIATVIFITIYLMFFCYAIAQGQNIVRKGNTFVEVVDSGHKTTMVYIDKDGNKYPIYVSSKGRHYILKVSKKTGKTYKRYLPKIDKQINKQQNDYTDQR